MVATTPPRRRISAHPECRLKTSPNPDRQKINEFVSLYKRLENYNLWDYRLKTSPTPQRKPTPSRKNPGHPQFSRQHPQRQSPRRLFASFQDTLNTATLRPCRRLGGVCLKVGSSRYFGSRIVKRPESRVRTLCLTRVGFGPP